MSVDPSTATGKAGGLSEHLCTVTRSRGQGIEEGMEEVEGLVPEPDLRMMMEIYPWQMSLMMGHHNEDCENMWAHTKTFKCTD